MKTSLLGSLEASESRAAVNLAKLLQSEVICKYPQLKFMCCVTDSATNIIKTAKELNIHHIPCFLHRVQTTVNKAIALISNSRDLVKLNNYNRNVGVLDDTEELDKVIEYVYLILMG